MHDHILVYARLLKSAETDSVGFQRDLLPRTEEQDAAYTNRDNDHRGPWKSGDLSISYNKKTDYAITTPSGREVNPPKGASWRVTREKYAEMAADNRIWFGDKGDGVPSIKRFLSEVQQGRVPTTWWTYEECGHNQDAQRDLAKLFTEKDPGFDTPKPVKLIRHMLNISAQSDPSALILDFFAGSGTTAQAVLEMNEEDSGNRKFILVQLPEVVDEDSAAAKAGFTNIAEITKERVRRVIKKLDGGVKDGLGLDGKKNLDRGFKVYALDRSNFVPWDATAATDAASLEKQLELAVDNVLHDRSDEDLLAEILLKTGFPLDTVITQVQIAGTPVYQVADPGFLVCLAKKVDAPLIKAIAATKPHRVVILDAAFGGNDALKTNAVQAFKDQGVEMFRTA